MDADVCQELGAPAHVPELRAHRLLRFQPPPARTAHYRESGHPVIRSAEPGESRRWCHVDLRLV